MDDSSGASSPAAAPPSFSSHRYPDWVMLDPRNLLLDCTKHAAVDHSESDDHLRSTNAHAMTTKGELIRVSFGAVPPPEVSRLSVRLTRTRHWLPEEGGRNRWAYYSSDERESLVVAAHRNCILLSLGRHWCYDSPQLFVYTVAGIAAGPPTLRPLLPNRYTSSPHHIGLVCDGGTNGFVAADLNGDRLRYICRQSDADTDTVAAEAVVYVFRSCSPSWTAMDPPPRIRHRKGHNVDLSSWSTDEVVLCGDSLCYVNYTQGVLFLDVLSRCPELRYVRLPAVKVPVTDPYSYSYERFTGRGHRAFPERSLCATDGGRTVKFVQVVTTTVFISRGRATASTLFNIYVWRLRLDDKDMTWEKESEMEDADLWALNGYGDLPRVAPTFPRVSMEEPNVIYFVLSSSHRQADEDETWVIAVDMSNKILQSSFRYTTKPASENQSANCAFIPCEFSKDLQVPETD